MQRKGGFDLFDQTTMLDDGRCPAPGRHNAHGGAELVRDAVDKAVDHPGTPVDDARLNARDGRLADGRGRGDEFDAADLRRRAEQTVGGRVDAGGDRTPEVLAVGRHDVEIYCRPEVHDDHRLSGPPSMSRNGVGYPIRSDLAWIVGQNGDPGSDARFHDNRRETKIP